MEMFLYAMHSIGELKLQLSASYFMLQDFFASELATIFLVLVLFFALVSADISWSQAVCKKKGISYVCLNLRFFKLSFCVKK